MRRAVVLGHRKLGIEEAEAPDPGPGEVRVRILACGICGSDLHYYHRNLMPIGHTPGHEIAGRIDALGPGVGGVTVGTRVAVEPLRSCGTCRCCREGRDSICREMRLHGIHMPGGLAERIVVPADRAVVLEDDLDAAVAALTEPVAVAVHGLDRAGFAPDQRVLVLGAGAVGLVTLVAARHLGAREVLVTARHAHQAALARRLGASRVIDEKDADAAGLDALGRAMDIDIAMETVGGGADTLTTATAAVRPGGRVGVLGIFLGDASLPAIPALLKEVSYDWSNCYQRPRSARSDFERAAAIVDAEREALATLVTDRFELGAVDAAFQRAADKSSGSMKVTVLTDR